MASPVVGSVSTTNGWHTEVEAVTILRVRHQVVIFIRKGSTEKFPKINSSAILCSGDSWGVTISLGGGWIITGISVPLPHTLLLINIKCCQGNDAGYGDDQIVATWLGDAGVEALAVIRVLNEALVIFGGISTGCLKGIIRVICDSVSDSASDNGFSCGRRSISGCSCIATFYLIFPFTPTKIMF